MGRLLLAPLGSRRFVGLVTVLGALTGCATEEQVEFGDPAFVAGGNSRGSGNVPVCIPNGACAKSWNTHVYPGIFDAPLDGDVPSGACGAPGCHDKGSGGLFFPSGNADEGFVRLTNFQLVGDRRYIEPCYPELSHVMCNLRFLPEVVNPYVGPDEELTGGCGSPMPKPDDLVPSSPLNQEQLDTLAEWIQCGAIDN
jgi:hypothetical protein